MIRTATFWRICAPGRSVGTALRLGAADSPPLSSIPLTSHIENTDYKRSVKCFALFFYIAVHADAEIGCICHSVNSFRISLHLQYMQFAMQNQLNSCKTNKFLKIKDDTLCRDELDKLLFPNFQHITTDDRGIQRGNFLSV